MEEAKLKRRTISSTYSLQVKDVETEEIKRVPIKNRLLEKPTEQIELSEIDRLTSYFKDEEQFLEALVKNRVITHTNYQVFIQRIKFTKNGVENLGQIYYPIYDTKEIQRITNNLFQYQTRQVSVNYVQNVLKELAEIIRQPEELQKYPVLDQNFQKLWEQYYKRYKMSHFISVSYALEYNQLLTSLLEKLSQYRIIRGFYLFKKMKEGYEPSYLFKKRLSSSNHNTEEVNPAFAYLEDFNISCNSCGDYWKREECLYWSEEELEMAYGKADDEGHFTKVRNLVK